MTHLEVVKYELGKRKYELKFYRIKELNIIYFLLDDIFNILKYEDDDRAKENKESFEKLMNKKGVIYLKDLFSWLSDRDELIIAGSSSEDLIPFSSLLTILNLSELSFYEKDMERFVSPTKFRLLKEFLEEKFKKEKMIEKLIEVPKNLNDILPPIEIYRPLDKTPEEIIKDGKNLMKLVEEREEDENEK